MKLITSISLIFLALTLTSCSESDPETETEFINCTEALETNGQCIRWIDRKIYFAFSNANSPERNNEFQKAKVQEALDEIQVSTSLGEGYFSYEEVDESLLNPLIEPEESGTEFKSFVLIWPDAVFNDFVVNDLGGNVPDDNGVAVINSAFKRKFYIILKASCFVSDANCNGITSNGLKALVARQLGLIIGLPPKSQTFCDSDPTDTMCTFFPEDSQWSAASQTKYSSSLNNILETISNNPNFYDEFVP